ncbi:CYTH domain-containing protein [Candidatus Gracilibacteria bacterium]|nr:CYTH domain-containing protein [Candidatus Gracilibacteria bacterium]
MTSTQTKTSTKQISYTKPNINLIEIEVKVLLGEEKNATNLIEKLLAHTDTKETGGSNQLNHYFLADGNFEILIGVLKEYINSDHHSKLENILLNANKHSIRTRDADGKVLFVVKASKDDTSSENGTARLEFEEQTPNLTINQLDQIILDAGFSYQSKWSRNRKDFSYKDFNVSIDKNAGYGYVAEFEKIISEDGDINQAKESIRQELNSLGIEELAQDRLERMFKYYNENRPEYYGTEKTFTIL